jgi:ABC-2 type transport system permease protein
MTTTIASAKTAPVAAPRRSTFAATARPKGPNAIVASSVHVWRAMLKMKHNFFGILAETTVTPILVLVIFSQLFGTAIAGSWSSYLQYFVPGVMVQSVALMTVYTGTFLSTDINKGIFNRFRTMPFWQPASIVGNVAADIVRYVAAMVSVLTVGLIMGFRPDGGVQGVVAGMAILALFAFAVSWIFAALGVVSKKPETVSTTTMVLMYPLMFTSNIFVPIDKTPGWMQAVVKANPITHATTAVRNLMQGTATTAQVGLVIGISAGLILVFATLTVVLYNRRRRG